MRKLNEELKELRMFIFKNSLWFYETRKVFEHLWCFLSSLLA